MLRVLEKLLESGTLETVKDLALDMYNFYHRQGLGLSWARNIDPEMELERIRLERREAVLVEDCLSRHEIFHNDCDIRKPSHSHSFKYPLLFHDIKSCVPGPFLNVLDVIDLVDKFL